MRETIPGRTYRETTRLFNEEAAKQGWPPITEDQLTGFARYHKIRSAMRIPHNLKPLGTVTKHGTRGGVYSVIKTDHPQRWRLLHVHLWEQAHGAVPKGHVVVFADRNPENLSLENLVCISRAHSAFINLFKIPYRCAETLKSAALIADLHMTMRRHTRRKRSGADGR